MLYDAFVGPRDLSEFDREQLALFRAEVSQSVVDDCVIRTGAAPGADQLAADTALSMLGEVCVCLPWPAYESKWVNSVEVEKIVFNPWSKDELQYRALNSVNDFHPNPKALTVGARRLMARNYLIVKPAIGVTVRRLVALCLLTKEGKIKGGTRQAVDIAYHYDIPVTLIHP